MMFDRSLQGIFARRTRVRKVSVSYALFVRNADNGSEGIRVLHVRTRGTDRKGTRALQGRFARMQTTGRKGIRVLHVRT